MWKKKKEIAVTIEIMSHFICYDYIIKEMRIMG